MCQGSYQVMKMGILMKPFELSALAVVAVTHFNTMNIKQKFDTIWHDSIIFRYIYMF